MAGDRTEHYSTDHREDRCAKYRPRRTGKSAGNSEDERERKAGTQSEDTTGM